MWICNGTKAVSYAHKWFDDVATIVRDLNQQGACRFSTFAYLARASANVGAHKLLRLVARTAWIIMGMTSTATHADFASRCAGCHGAISAQPQNSGPIRAANNRPYLDYKISNGMGNFRLPGEPDDVKSFERLPESERDQIVLELKAQGYGPTFTSEPPPNGVKNGYYNFRFESDAKPSLLLVSA